jgi:hypothetical protein
VRWAVEWLGLLTNYYFKCPSMMDIAEEKNQGATLYSCWMVGWQTLTIMPLQNQ